MDDEANIGFFSVLNTEACVQNVRLEDVSISVTGTASGKRVRAGGVAGATVGNTRERTAVIDNCLVSGEISVTTDNAMGYAAGIAGQLNGGGAIINCVARVNVAGYGTGNAGRPYVGGISANNGNNSVIVNCAVTGSLSSNGQESSGYIGGLGGMLTGVVENCLTEADVLLSGDSAMNAGLVSGMMLTDSSMLYYAGDAALSIGGNAAEAQPYGMNNVGAEAVSMTKADMRAAAFAETLNGNLYNTFKALDKEALPLRLWVYRRDSCRGSLDQRYARRQRV